MELIWTIVIGLVVGLLARLVMPGRQKMGLILTTLLGIAGAFIGTFIGRALGLYEGGEAAGFIMSLLGALLLLAIVGAIRKKT